MPNWTQLGQTVLSLFLHPNCPLCGRSADRILCSNCRRQLHQCQLSHPQFQGKGNLPGLAWGNYSGLLKRAIASLKYEQQAQLARPLGEFLGEAWLKRAPVSAADKPVIVPIPLHPEKEKQRGYNQADLIARAFCDVTRLPLQSQGLKRIKHTDALFGLTPQEREQQVANAFIAGKTLRPQQNVILLDDIYTTGATVQAAVSCLQKAGVKAIGLCVVAKP